MCRYQFGIGATSQHWLGDDAGVAHGGGLVGTAAGLLLGAVAISGCAAGPATGPAESQPSRQASPAAASPSTGAERTASAALTRCLASVLKVRLGAKSPAADAVGQYQVPLVITNTGDQPCTLRGWPAVELRGPNDPNGPTYQLPDAQASPRRVELAVGGSAEALITYLKYEPGDMGSLGSTNWTPTTVAVTPPGEVGRLIVPWTPGDPVLRQDEASHPGTYVGPVLPG